MWWHLTKKRDCHTPVSRKAYTLIELMVVLAIMTILGLAALPNVANTNDRNSLNQAANQLKTYILDAQTRSLASSSSDGSGIVSEIYQVALGNFATTNNPIKNGAIAGQAGATDVISLQSGLAQCGSGDQQGGFTTISSYALPRNIYITSFFPMNAVSSQAVVRFSVGKVGFSCGSSSNPSLQSTDYTSQDPTIPWNGSTDSRYLVIDLTGDKISDHRFVSVDRQTATVTISNSNPQSSFTALEDKLPPQWPKKPTLQLGISCSATDPSTSTVTITFSQATDYVGASAPGIADPTRPIYYEISWALGNKAFIPLAKDYSADPTVSPTTYSFTTSSLGTGNIGSIGNILLQIVASDGPSGSDSTNIQTSKQWLTGTFPATC